MNQILFVDDDLMLSSMVAEYLQEKGFQVTLKHNAAEGLHAFRTGSFDCCIFDVRMPFRDGFSLAEDVRELDDAIPIIFLTGQGTKEDRIKGLMIGADDYITKPFSMEELFLRIKAILKRVQVRVENRPTQYQIGLFFFDSIARDLTGQGETFKLSAIESKLLQLLCDNANELVTRNHLLNQIWKDEDELKGRSLNVYITRLRNHLKADPDLEILNVHGEGYRLIVRE